MVPLRQIYNSKFFLAEVIGCLRLHNNMINGDLQTFVPEMGDKFEFTR